MFSFHIYASDDEVTIEDYNGKRIGVLVGPLTEDIAKEYFPDSEHLLLNSYPDCVTALLTNKIDGYLADEPGLKMVCAEQPEITYLPERMMVNNYSFAFRKNDPQSAALCDEVSEFIRRCWEDGTMKEIDEIWFGMDEERKVVDMSDLSKNGRIIKVATTASDIPFSYIKDGKYVGYDIDVVVRFCREKGYGLEIVDMDFTARIPSVEAGKCDFTTGMNVTPERQEQVLFSEPDGYGGIVLAIRKADLENRGGNSSYKSIDDLAGKRIGVTTGSIHDQLVSDRLPSAQIMYFSGLTDLPVALKASQIDAFVCPRSAAIFMRYEDDRLAWLDEHLKDAGLAFAFPKSEEGKILNEKISEYIRKMKADGSLEELRDKWFGENEEAKTMIDYSSLPDTNGTLHVVSAAQQVPYCYVREGVVVGLEIEIIVGFCEENGYSLQTERVNLDGVLASVQTGKADFAASCLAVTEERKES
ncbi:MAG: transporter substrate-binding domain-containing protein, partial [Erysipelotrichaceae bacterium]|nr:transporter substrate-binding domain-containing protein [Erysipelotrichaceae bacterium]